jgi:hypothetical protein
MSAAQEKVSGRNQDGYLSKDEWAAGHAALMKK